MDERIGPAPNIGAGGIIIWVREKGPLGALMANKINAKLHFVPPDGRQRRSTDTNHSECGGKSLVGRMGSKPL